MGQAETFTILYKANIDGQTMLGTGLTDMYDIWAWEWVNWGNLGNSPSDS